MNKVPVRKRWGQNFINDKNLINKIINSFNPDRNDIILEIGPGKGALTYPLSKKVKKIIAVEIDPVLISLLKKKLNDNVILINDDILKFVDTSINKGFKIIGNLPYYITTPIIFKFLESKNWSKMTIMVQKEVADRMIAIPGNKNYGRLSIMIQAQALVEKHFDISSNLFFPKPKVKSTLISIIPRNNLKLNKTIFYSIIKLAFQKRRKILKNSVSSYLNDENKKIYGHLRPENISVENYIKISQSCINDKKVLS